MCACVCECVREGWHIFAGDGSSGRWHVPKFSWDSSFFASHGPVEYIFFFAQLLGKERLSVLGV